MNFSKNMEALSLTDKKRKSGEFESLIGHFTGLCPRADSNAGSSIFTSSGVKYMFPPESQVPTMFPLVIGRSR